MFSRLCWPCWASLAASVNELLACSKKALRGLFFVYYMQPGAQCSAQFADINPRRLFHPMTLRPFITAVVLLLVGCDIPGMGPDPRIAQREAEANAIGAACRYGLRGIEDCYNLNEDVSKAAIFTGWKDMDQYMRENKIEGVQALADKPEAAEEVVVDAKSKADAKEKTSEANPKTPDKASAK